VTIIVKDPNKTNKAKTNEKMLYCYWFLVGGVKLHQFCSLLCEQHIKRMWAVFQFILSLFLVLYYDFIYPLSFINH